MEVSETFESGMGHLGGLECLLRLARIAQRSSCLTIEVVKRRFGGSSERKKGAETGGAAVVVVVVEH